MKYVAQRLPDGRPLWPCSDDMIPDALQSALHNRFHIERVVGQGSMATVYLAHDQKHGRKVAVKVLNSELSAALGPERFRREIEVAARLSHPNILPLYDSGQVADLFYYVMPYVDGESLRDRLRRDKQLPLDDAIEIARQVADALSYAHGAGIVHRDVKPENILLAHGHAFLTDFGIARVTHSTGPEQLTQTGLVVGTPAYMSPEQVSGQREVDGRSDIYALGCVVYEIVAGQPPFTGPTLESVIRQHLALEPPPVNALRPTASPGWAKLLARALAKSPGDRFSAAADFAAAVTALRGSARERGQGVRADKVMLAVLPLDNFSRNPEEEYFSDGLSEELITQIAKLSPHNLGVIARTTAMRYKNTGKSIAEIGLELGVEFVLEGSARRADDRVRITVQLIKVEDQTHLWAETYDRRMTDVFEVQEDVARKVAGALEVRLLGEGRTQARPGPAPQAYDAYLKGLHFARTFFLTKSPTDYGRAAQGLKDALNADSRFAEANAALARLAFEHYRDYGDRANLVEADERAQRLLQTDPNSASARGTAASVLLWSGQKELAIREARIALELNPAEAAAREALGVGYYMSGMIPEGTEQFIAWRRIDPLAPAPYRRIVDGYLWTGNLEHARALLEEALTLFPQSPVFRRHLARVHYQSQDFDAAEDLLRQSLELEPFRGFEARAQLALVYARTGRREAGKQLLTTPVLDYAKRDFLESILYPAQFHALNAEPAEALTWLEAAVSAGNENYAWFSNNADFDPLRDRPEFQALMARVRSAADYFKARYGG